MMGMKTLLCSVLRSSGALHLHQQHVGATREALVPAIRLSTLCLLCDDFFEIFERNLFAGRAGGDVISRYPQRVQQGIRVAVHVCEGAVLSAHGMLLRGFFAATVKAMKALLQTHVIPTPNIFR